MFALPPPDVQQELDALRREVAEVRRAWDDRWIDQARADEIRTIIRDVLADSATRTLAAGGPLWHSPYGGGIAIGSADGNWTLQAGVTEQVKFVYANAYGNGNSSTDDQTRWGWELRRMNLIMAGTLIDPTVSYLLMMQYDSQPDRWSDKPGTISPVYAWMAKDLGEGWSVMVGNQNVPWDVQTDYLEGCSMVAGDYSIFNYRFGLGREPGITAEFRSEALRLRGGAFSQLGLQTERWDSTANLSFALAGRAEVQWGASWDSLEIESSFRGTATSLVLGVAGAWSEGRAENPASPPTPSVQGMTADVTARLSGAMLQAQVAYMRDAAGAPELEWSTGVQVQASWFLTDRVEAFAQACWMDTSGVPWIMQAGANVYLSGSRLKLTGKAFVPFGGGQVNGIGQLSGGLGMSASSNNASLVAQVQVMW